MALIGLDIGTNACKAIVFAQDGRILGRAAREYPIDAPAPGWAEQDLERVWSAACDALTQAIATAGPADPPAALALSVQGEAVAPVDAEGRPLRPAILGMDTRTVAENAWLGERLGAEWLYGRTGMPLHTINTLPKLLWLERHEPDIWRAARRFLLYEDFFLQRLTGAPCISHCLASRTQLYDLALGQWSSEILAASAISVERLAPLAPMAGGVVGTVRDGIADGLGLPRGLPVAAGGHDQACAALGSGVTRPGCAMVSTGTAEVVEVALPNPQVTAPLRIGGISVYRHIVPGLYLAMTLNHSGGLLLRWFRDEFCPGERDAALAAGRDPYDAILAEAPEAPTDLLVLPHWAGSGTPTLDTRSRGAILGLTFGTTRGALAKAILEGLTFELRANLDVLRQGGILVEALHAVGGGARSPLWLQLKADITGAPLRVPVVTEAACLGAALLAGSAAGVYADLDDAVAQTVRIGADIQPDPAAVAQYDARYALYAQLYPTLRGLLHQL